MPTEKQNQPHVPAGQEDWPTEAVEAFQKGRHIAGTGVHKISEPRSTMMIDLGFPWCAILGLNQ